MMTWLLQGFPSVLHPNGRNKRLMTADRADSVVNTSGIPGYQLLENVDVGLGGKDDVWMKEGRMNG